MPVVPKEWARVSTAAVLFQKSERSIWRIMEKHDVQQKQESGRTIIWLPDLEWAVYHTKRGGDTTKKRRIQV